MLTVARTMLVIAACGVVALTGCSASVSTEEPAVSQENVEEGVMVALEELAGRRPDSVECPGELKAKVGESIRCELSAGTDRYGLTATVTSVDDGNAKFDVKVDSEPAT